MNTDKVKLGSQSLTYLSQEATNCGRVREGLGEAFPAGSSSHPEATPQTNLGNTPILYS